MALQAVGITLGNPNVAGEVSVTVSNLAAAIAQSVTDTTTLSGQVTTTGTDTTTADTNMGTVQSQVNTVKADTAAVVSDFTTLVADAVSVANGANGVVASFLNQSFNSSTLQYSGTPGGSATVTVAQQQAIVAFLNTLGAKLISSQTDGTTADNAAATAVTNCTSAKAATATAKADAAALPAMVTAIATDHTNAQAIIASANVYLQFDDGVVSNVATLNAGLVAGLTFVRHSNILPT